MKTKQIPQKLVYRKFYVHEIADVDLSKNYFLKNAKKNMQTKQPRFKSRLNKSKQRTPPNISPEYP